ncbi:MAG: hypothetical protein IM638_03085 [Bacteroidetes bacterium]|nr:hypothetical protein [Bacteroidota bacterium]
MEKLSDYLFHSNLTAAQKCLDSGDDINGDEETIRPIIAAINSNNPEVLSFLIQHKADVNIDFGSPLSEAIDYCIDGMLQNNRDIFYPEALEMVRLLIAAGAKPDIQNENGKRPIDLLTRYSKNHSDNSIDKTYFEKLKLMFNDVIPDIDSYFK